MIVTQRAPQLYAQSLRGGSKTTETKHKEATSQATAAKTPSFPVPWWLIGTAGGGAIATVAFMAGAFWSNRRTFNQLVSTSAELAYDASAEYLNNSAKAQKTPEWVVDNHRLTERNEQSCISNKNI